MKIEEQALALLNETEAHLRRLVAEAAEAGDYPQVIRVATWAKAVGDLVRSASERPQPGALAAPQNGVGILRLPKSAPIVRKRVPRRQDYPRFFRQGDNLVRVSWSKRDGAEYQHKAAYSTLKALVAATTEFGKDGRVFSTDQLLPIRDPESSADIPNYQSYVCISWLKEIGLLDQHGRRGYSIPSEQEFQDLVESIWRKVPTG